MNLKISAAVAAVIACSAVPAFASDLATTTGVQNGTIAGVVVNASGASAQRDAFLSFMARTICQAGSFDMYRAAPTGGQDFRAYSCRIVNNAGIYGGAANQLAVVFYRSEGGSAWGPVPMSQRNAVAPFYTPANDIAVMRLNVDGTCTTTSTASVGTVNYTVHDCPLPTNDYQLASDTSASADANLTLDTVDLGVADEEPKMFTGVNFPTVSTRLTAIPSGSRDSNLGQLNNIAQVGFGQLFGVVVNNTTGPLAGAPNATRRNIGKNVVAGIFNGTYTDWSQVISGDGTLVNPGGQQIKVCRREPGSGTQVAAHQYFLGTPGCKPQFPNGTFVTDGADADNTNLAADTDGVIERGTSADLATCVGTLPGAIGIVVGNAAPANTVFLNLDGRVPDRNLAAVGGYDYWFEQTFTINPRLGAGAVQDLAQALIDEAKLSGSAPNVASVISLPNDNNDPLGQGAFVAGTPPISFGTRGGNSCTPIVPIAP